MNEHHDRTPVAFDGLVGSDNVQPLVRQCAIGNVADMDDATSCRLTRCFIPIKIALWIRDPALDCVLKVQRFLIDVTVYNGHSLFFRADTVV